MQAKIITKNSYEATAREFANNVRDLAPKESIDRFAKLLPPQAKIIDIGCAAGRDAKLFTEKGISVLGIDYCQNLVDLAKEHAPLATFQVVDLEELSLSASSFDGAWAGCTFSHIPKDNLPSILKNVYSLLKQRGYFYLTVKKGTGEGAEKDLRYGDYEKFWSFFGENEIKEFVEQAGFKVIECCTVERRFEYHTHACVRIFCQKN